jgi:signal transduction histidine kinase/CheY-like chemotaxis protein
MNENLSIGKRVSIFFEEVVDWFSTNRYLNENSFTTRLRYFQITAFLIFFVTSFLNFLSNYGASYCITATACFVLVIIRYVLDRNKIMTAYYSLLICINLALILLTAVGGIESGVFLFFFPAIISFVFLVDVNNKKNVFVTYTISLGSFMIAILLAKTFNLQEILKKSHKDNFQINLLFSFSLIGWMSYSLASENKKKQGILKNKEVFLDTVFNSSLHAEIIVDIKDGLISDHNSHASLLFAAQEGDILINKPLQGLFLESMQKEESELFQEMCNPLKNWNGELTCQRVDGSVFPASISIVSFQYNNKEYKKITITDITEKNQILNDLHAAKRKAEELAHIKSQFLSHMSHELRTPLNGIIGSTNLLLQDKCLPEQNEQLNVLKFSSEHMLNLINDILDLSKLEADKIQLEKNVVDIGRFINSVASPFIPQYEEKDVLFEVEIDDNLKRPILADTTRLNQILTNLLSNALKFTVNGSVKLIVKGLSVKSDSNNIEFSIIDTGIGISEENRKKIFEQFAQADVRTTRRYGGTGLGLTISQKLVNLMGGELKVESKYNKGSRFYFDITVPVHAGKEKAYVNDKVILKNEGKLKGLKILIAEDNPINMMIASRFLDKWGVVHEKAKNGLEAVSLFDSNSFDVLLMDLDMPEMDGYGALDAIRKMNPNIPAIAFTAAVFDNMKESLRSSGFDDYIQKPFRPEDLHSKLVAFSGNLGKSA